MADVVTRFKVESTEYEKKVKSAGKSLNDFGKKGREASSFLDEFDKKLSSSSGSLKGFFTAAGAAGAAFSIGMKIVDSLTEAINKLADFDAIINSTQETTDDFARKTAQAQAALDAFHHSIATGTLGTFVSDLEQVTKEAAELYNTLDALGSLEMRSNFALGMLEAQRDIYQLRVRDKSLSDEEKKTAADMLDLYNKRIAAMRGNLGQTQINAGVQTIQNEIHANRRAIVGDSNLNSTFNPYNVLTGMAKNLEVSEADIMDYAVNGSQYAKEAQDAIEQYAHDMNIAVKKYTETNDVYWKNIQEGLLSKFKMEFTAFPERLIALVLDQVRDDSESNLATAFNTILAGAQQKTIVANAQYQQNRYTKSATSTNADSQSPEGSIAALNKELSKAQEALNNSVIGTNEWEVALNRVSLLQTKIKDANSGLVEDNDILIQMMENVKPLESAHIFPEGSIAALTQELNAAKDALNECVVGSEEWQAAMNWLNGVQEKIDKANASLKTQSTDAKNAGASWSAAGSAIGKVGSALTTIDDPTTKIIGLIAQAIASVASGAGQAMAAKDTTASGWAWIGAAAAITAEMITIISTIKSTAHYADGGMVGSNSLKRGTDTVPAMLTPGEIVLNRAQQSNLANQLGDSGRGGQVEFRIKDRELVGILSNYNNRQSNKL